MRRAGTLWLVSGEESGNAKIPPSVKKDVQSDRQRGEGRRRGEGVQRRRRPGRDMRRRLLCLRGRCSEGVRRGRSLVHPQGQARSRLRLRGREQAGEVRQVRCGVLSRVLYHEGGVRGGDGGEGWHARRDIAMLLVPLTLNLGLLTCNLATDYTDFRGHFGGPNLHIYLHSIHKALRNVGVGS